MPAGPRDDVSSGPTRSDVCSASASFICSGMLTCSRRGSRAPIPPTEFTASCQGRCRTQRSLSNAGALTSRHRAQQIHSFICFFCSFMRSFNRSFFFFLFHLLGHSFISFVHETPALMSQFTTLCPVSLPSYWWFGDRSKQIWFLKAWGDSKRTFHIRSGAFTGTHTILSIHSCC